MPRGPALAWITLCTSILVASVTRPMGIEASVEDGVLPHLMPFFLLSWYDRGNPSRESCWPAHIGSLCHQIEPAGISFAQSSVLKDFKIIMHI